MNIKCMHSYAFLCCTLRCYIILQKDDVAGADGGINERKKERKKERERGGGLVDLHSGDEQCVQNANVLY